MTDRFTFDPWGKEPPPDDPLEENLFDRTWQPVNLDPVLDGTHTPPEPTVGRRADKIGILYPTKVHTIASESEAGKTWLALTIARDELDAGNHVLYTDFEDNETGIVSRLLTIGTHRDRIREQFHYLSPRDPLGTGINRDDLNTTLELAPTFACLDGITEGMVLHGLDPLSNKDSATFGRLLPRYIANHGPAVACLDHVTKDREGRGRYAIGAVHKLNGLDGAAYILDNRTPFGIGVTGRSTIRLAKDRPGQLRRHGLPSTGGLHWYGDLVVNSHTDTFTEVDINPPVERTDDFRPTLLMARITAAITLHGPLSQRSIRAAVPGRNDTITHALDCLILDGYVTDKTPHHLLKPYVEPPQP